LDLSIFGTGNSAVDGFMYDYRLYRLDKSGHILGPPDGFSCENDEVAIERSKRLVDSHDAELWQSDRMVTRLPHDK
jgi:hypothetical protein